MQITSTTLNDQSSQAGGPAATSVSDLNNGATAAPADATTAGANDGVSKDAFLKLLVAQLKNQDPSSPVDNGQFISQLASFQSLEGQLQSNATLGQLVDLQRSQVALQGLSQAATLVGRTVSWKDPQTGASNTGTISSVGVEQGTLVATTENGKVPVGLINAVSAASTAAAGTTVPPASGTTTTATTTTGTTTGTTSTSTDPNAGTTAASPPTVGAGTIHMNTPIDGNAIGAPVRAAARPAKDLIGQPMKRAADAATGILSRH